jgi:hypothetical protein
MVGSSSRLYVASDCQTWPVSKGLLLALVTCVGALLIAYLRTGSNP